MFGLSKGKISPADQLVLYHEDFAQKDVSEALVGRKGYSLFKLREMDIPVPDFFVISPSVFKSHLLAAFEGKLDKVVEKMDYPDLLELEKLISKATFEDDFLEQLAGAYSRISGFSKAWVAVRSSVVYPQNRNISFGGLFATELNVRGFENLVEGVKQVYISVFRDRVARYANTHGVKLSDLQMAVVVQKMVQPEVSGVVYTVDPVTSSPDKLGVEAVFGLGDVIADGEITPDQYILNKRDLRILEKHIAPQEWMKIRKPRGQNDRNIEEFERIQISKSWSHQQKLEDRHVELVSKIALIVEENSNAPQAVEWVWEGGGVWILQSKDLITPEKLEPIVSVPKEQAVAAQIARAQTTSDSLYDLAVDIVKEGKEKDFVLRTHNLMDSIEQNNIANVELPKAVVTQASRSEEDLMQKGVNMAEALSNSQNNGGISLINTNKDVQKELVEIKKDQDSIDRLERLERKLASVMRKTEKTEEKFKAEESVKTVTQLTQAGITQKPTESDMQFILSGIGASYGHMVGSVKLIKTGNEIVTKDNIVVLKRFDRSIEDRILEAGGVVMDEGGITSDVAIICRENRIPAVVGTTVASSILNEGDLVKIDGNAGSVYRAISDNHKVLESNTSDKVEAATESKYQYIEQTPNKTVITPVVEKKEYHFPRTATKVLLRPDMYKEVDSYKELISASDGVSCVDLDKLMLVGKRHPLSHVENKTYSAYIKGIEKHIDSISDHAQGNEVIVTIGSRSSAQFKGLVKGKAFESSEVGDGSFGAQRLLANKELLTRELGVVKRLRNLYRSRNISLAIHSPMSGYLMGELKKEMGSLGLKRNTTFAVYAVLDRSSEAVLVGDIVSAQLDGVIFNAKRIAKEIQGIAYEDANSKYYVDSNSVFKLLQEVVDRLKGSKVKVFVLADDNEKLIKHAVDLGVYAILSSEENYSEAKEIVASQEAKAILNFRR